jgi:hypothetical protein
MTYKTETASSDSVNLGSNPSSPATRTADVSGVSHAPGGAEKSEQSEQTAHTGRTETGTAFQATDLPPIYCDATGEPCFWPACFAHSCMDARSPAPPFAKTE